MGRVFYLDSSHVPYVVKHEGIRILVSAPQVIVRLRPNPLVIAEFFGGVIQISLL